MSEELANTLCMPGHVEEHLYERTGANGVPVRLNVTPEQAQKNREDLLTGYRRDHAITYLSLVF